MEQPRERSKQLFHAALELPSAARAAFLTQACGEDTGLHARVLALLTAHSDASGFLAEPAFPRGAAEPAGATGGELRPGDVIDRYHLLEEIGEGGMGTVWMAEQKEPIVRKVALKIIKLGMDTKEVVTRFEAERQALALMDHPAIAKVFDGGVTATGRPFFVMELVKGIPITRFCDEERLGLRERLELFAKVCEAIQHAHQKGIIHRDVKPSNVLITLHDGTPLPKVIDFGIAKATSAELTRKTMFTRYAQMVGTPEYMAPEQAAMSALDVDTRADVYSLGVLLYELLTGTKPFEITKVLEKGYEELLRTIREDDPAKPSTRVSTLGDKGTTIAAQRHVNVDKLKNRLRGDLDWIVMKALEKDRTRRYETANGFAMDVYRYLRDEPVAAAPPSASYRLKKFIGRRKKTVAAVAVIAFLLVAGSISTGIGWYEAGQANRALGIAIDDKELERKKADEAKQLAQIAEAAAKADAERARLAEAEATKRAAEIEQVSEFQQKQLSDFDVPLMGVRLRRSLIDAAPEDRREALTTNLVGLNFTSLALGSLEQNLFGRTIAAIDAQFADQPLVQARLLHTVARTLRQLGLLTLATDPQQRALAIRGAKLGGEHPDTLASISNMGSVLQAQGRLAEAEPFFRQALAGYQRVLGNDHPHTLVSIGNMGALLEAQGKLGEAEPFFREALVGNRRVLGDEHQDTLTSINNMGFLLKAQGKLGEAEPFYREALASRRRVLGDEHPGTLNSINSMGTLLMTQGKLAEAEPFFGGALAGYRRVLGDEHPSTLNSINSMGFLLQAQGKLAEAEPFLRESLGGNRRLLGDDHPNTLTSLNNLGDLLRAKGKLAEAEPFLREALGGNRRLLGDDHPNTLNSINSMGSLLQAQGKFAEAEPFFREALVGNRRVLGDEHRDTLRSINNMGSLLQAQGKRAEAEPFLREALGGNRRLLGDDHPSTLISLNNMGDLLRAQGKLAEAEPFLREALASHLRVLGEDHPDTLNSLNNMGSLLQAQGKLAEAEPFHREALSGRRRVLGDNHPNTLISINNLGDLLRAQGKLAEAEPFLHEALGGNRRLLGDDHPNTLNSLNNMGSLLQAQGKLAEAEPFHREALSGRRRVLGDSHPNTLISINNLGDLLRAQGKLAEAEPFHREALSGMRRVLGDSHPNTLISLNNMGFLLEAQGKLDEAEPLFAERVEALRRANRSSPELATGLANLGICYFELGRHAEAEAAFTDSLQIRTGILPASDWRLWGLRHYIGACLGKQGRHAEAEAMLLEAAQWLLTNPAMPKVAVLRRDRAGEAAQHVVEFYGTWHAAEPGKGHDGKAAAWRAKLAAHNARHDK